MLNALKDKALIKKFGGRFKLTALIQKRLKELVHGSRPLIEDTKGKSLLEIVVQEIIENKIAPEYEETGTDKIGE